MLRSKQRDFYGNEFWGGELNGQAIIMDRVTDERGDSFWQGERKVLVAELMSERSEANKLRSACRAQGLPYVRFYYDHDGWWKTRSYVVSRTRAALGL